MKREHLIDVTEVFRVLSVEKKLRVVKLGFYLLLFVLVMTRFAPNFFFHGSWGCMHFLFLIMLKDLVFACRIYAAGTFSVVMSVFHSDNEELDIRSSILEF